MAIRLKFPSPDRPLALALRTILFGVLFAVAAASDFGILRTSFFLLGAIAIYARAPFRGSPSLTRSFASLLAASLVFTPLFAGVFSSTLLAVFFSVAFALLLGVRGLFFVESHRRNAQASVDLFLIYLVFAAYFVSESVVAALPRMLILLAVSFFFFRNAFATLAGVRPEETVRGKRVSLGAAIAALLGGEFAWALGALPLSPIGAASITALITFTLGNILVLHERHSLSRQIAVANVLVVALGIFLLFAASRLRL